MGSRSPSVIPILITVFHILLGVLYRISYIWKNQGDIGIYCGIVMYGAAGSSTVGLRNILVLVNDVVYV
jgi:hypothetical protein